MDFFMNSFYRGSLFSYLTLSLGAVVNIGCVVVVVLIAKKKSSSFNNGISLAGFVSVLVIMGVALIGHWYEWSLVQRAICALPEYMTALKLKGYADSMHNVSVGLFAITFPLMLSIVLLVTGLMQRSPDDRKPGNLLSIIVFIAGMVLGVGMGIKALHDYLGFDEVLLLLDWL